MNLSTRCKIFSQIGRNYTKTCQNLKLSDNHDKLIKVTLEHYENDGKMIKLESNMGKFRARRPVKRAKLQLCSKTLKLSKKLLQNVLRVIMTKYVRKFQKNIINALLDVPNHIHSLLVPMY